VLANLNINYPVRLRRLKIDDLSQAPKFHEEPVSIYDHNVSALGVACARNAWYFKAIAPIISLSFSNIEHLKPPPKIIKVQS
jgi:hypothetical protein